MSVIPETRSDSIDCAWENASGRNNALVRALTWLSREHRCTMGRVVFMSCSQKYKNLCSRRGRQPWARGTTPAGATWRYIFGFRIPRTVVRRVNVQYFSTIYKWLECIFYLTWQSIHEIIITWVRVSFISLFIWHMVR